MWRADELRRTIRLMQLPRPGDLFDGRYQIESVLGEGGFATVFAALDIRLGARVALKVLRPENGSSYRPDTRARFRREVGILERLKHPNIVDQLGYGESADGRLFVVFELLFGRDLTEVLEERGRLDPIVVASVLRQLLGALDAAHTAGLLHRDLKPQNVRVVGDADQALTVKLLDFGIARSADTSHPSITKTGELIGTPRYMSPEQLRGVALDANSDIYSLGLVAFELLMGKSALTGSSIFEQIERMRTGHLWSVPELERANPGLLAIIQRMTARAADERYQSARAALSALEALGTSGGFTTENATVSLLDETVNHPTPESARRPGRPARISPRVLVVLSILGLAGVLAVAAAIGLTDEPAPAPVAVTKTQTPDPPTVAKTTTPTPANVNAELELDDEPTGSPISQHGSSGCRNSPPFANSGKLNDQLLTMLPLDYTGERMHPVIMLLHHKGRAASELVRESGFADIVDQHGIIIIAPSAADMKGDWGEPKNDLPFLRGQLDLAEAELCIDRSRVFAVSHRTGGRAVANLSCVPWITGVAFHSFGVRLNDDPRVDPPSDVAKMFCADSPKPTIWLAPKRSRYIPTTSKRPCHTSRHFLPLERVEAMWKERNDCSDERQEVELDGGDCHTWSCKTPLRVCLLDGGIAWPGTVIAAGKGLLLCADEPPGADFPIVEEIWRFFESIEPNSADAPSPTVELK